MTNLPRLFPPEDLMTDDDRRRRQQFIRILSIGYRRALAKEAADNRQPGGSLDRPSITAATS